MFYLRLVSDEAEVIPTYYLEQYQKEGGSLDAWELNDEILGIPNTLLSPMPPQP